MGAEKVLLMIDYAGEGVVYSYVLCRGPTFSASWPRNGWLSAGEQLISFVRKYEEKKKKLDKMLAPQYVLVGKAISNQEAGVYLKLKAEYNKDVHPPNG